MKSLTYRTIGNRELQLDLYHPGGTKPAPVVLWFHGGGWKQGDRTTCPFTWLPRHGYAVASVTYRLSGEALWPAQIQDAKAAVAFLRYAAAWHNLDPDRIAASGTSAGGHLAALLGVTADQPQWRDDEYCGMSDKVQAVIDGCGPSDMVASTLPAEQAGGGEGHQNLIDAVIDLFGSPPDQHREAALAASPIHHVSPDSAPLLIVQGDDDHIVPPRQSVELADALRRVGAPVELRMIPGIRHSVRGWLDRPEAKAAVLEFLGKWLGK